MACLYGLLVLRLIGFAVSSYGLRISSVRHATEPKEEARQKEEHREARKNWADYSDSDEDFEEAASVWFQKTGEDKEIWATRKAGTREASSWNAGDSRGENGYDPTAVSMQSRSQNTGAQTWETSSPQAGADGFQQIAWLYVPAGDVQQRDEGGYDGGTYYWDGVSYTSYVGEDGVQYFQPSQRWVPSAQSSQSISSAASSAYETRTGVEVQSTVEGRDTGYEGHQAYSDKQFLWSERDSQRPTTVMLRNFPRTYTKADIIRELNLFGSKGKFDFLHVPMSLHNAIPLPGQRVKNNGMAFVNFIDDTWAAKCLKEFRRHQWMGCSREIKRGISAVPAYVQGLEKNLEHYKNTLINNDPINAPLVLKW